MITCFKDDFLKTTFSKFDNALTFLNTCTQGGMFKPKLTDKELHKFQLLTLWFKDDKEDEPQL